MSDPGNKRNPLGSLHSMEEKLYSRREVPAGTPNTSHAPTERPTQATDTESVPTSWQAKPSSVNMPKRSFLHAGILPRLTLIAGIFFVVALGIAAYVFFGGANRVSTSNVDIEVVGPAAAGAGEALVYDIVVTNKNNVVLEGLNLLVEYPSGTRTATENGRELLRDSELIGSIPENGTVHRTKQAVLFGEADNVKTIMVSVEYRVKDSSATYFKEQPYEVVISTAPVRLEVKSLEEVVSGQEIELTADITSNSSSVISGLLLRADYPFGFSYLGATPAPAFGNNIFAVGDLKPGDRREITIRGKLEGQLSEERSFRVTLGLRDQKQPSAIGTVFLVTNKTITLMRPFIGVTLEIDGSSADPQVISAGNIVRGELSWTNNLQSRITDVSIQAKLSGESLDRLSIRADHGFWQSIDNLIRWDRSTDNQFVALEPGESGSATFSFSSLPQSSLIYAPARGNEIAIDISIKGHRFSEANVPEEVESVLSRKIRVNTAIQVAGRSLYFTGPFANQGPIPPQAEKNTTYTIIWSLTNSLNNVSDATVRAVLPGYVTWLGQTSAGGDSVTYDSTTREVMWYAGDVAAGAGFGRPIREAAFQISLVPSLSQLGQTPVIVGPTTATAVDRYTAKTVKDTLHQLTTRIDDGFNQQGNTAVVVQ